MSLRSELIEACHKVYQKGFVAAYDGNLSVKTNRNTILITPSGKCKGELRNSDILEIDINGRIIKGEHKISSEFRLHLLAYKKRPDIKCVIHCHPIYATALATVGKDMIKPVFPEVILTIGAIPLCKYATPSSKELADSVLPFIHKSWALLLENHGAVTFGKNIKEAYYRMEKLEHSAHTLVIAKLLGKEKILSKKQVSELYNLGNKSQKRKQTNKTFIDNLQNG